MLNFLPLFSRASSTTELLQLSIPVNLSQIRAGRERSRGGSELFTRRAFYNIYIQRLFPFSCVLESLPVPQRTPELPQLSQLATTHFPAYREERSCGSSELFCMRSCLFTHVTIHLSDCSGSFSPKIPYFRKNELCLEIRFIPELVSPFSLPTSRFFSSSVGGVSSTGGFILPFHVS